MVPDRSEAGEQVTRQGALRRRLRSGQPERVRDRVLEKLTWVPQRGRGEYRGEGRGGDCVCTRTSGGAIHTSRGDLPPLNWVDDGADGA